MKGHPLSFNFLYTLKSEKQACLHAACQVKLASGASKHFLCCYTSLLSAVTFLFLFLSQCNSAGSFLSSENTHQCKHSQQVGSKSSCHCFGLLQPPCLDETSERAEPLPLNIMHRHWSPLSTHHFDWHRSGPALPKCPTLHKDVHPTSFSHQVKQKTQFVTDIHCYCKDESQSPGNKVPGNSDGLLKTHHVHWSQCFRGFCCS